MPYWWLLVTLKSIKIFSRARANIEQKAYGASLNATIGIVSVIRLSLKAD